MAKDMDSIKCEDHPDMKFRRPQDLGLHRRREHNIKGQNATRRERRGRPKKAVGVSISLTFCPHCGEVLPNAFLPLRKDK